MQNHDMLNDSYSLRVDFIVVLFMTFAPIVRCDALFEFPLVFLM